MPFSSADDGLGDLLTALGESCLPPIRLACDRDIDLRDLGGPASAEAILQRRTSTRAFAPQEVPRHLLYGLPERARALSAPVISTFSALHVVLITKHAGNVSEVMVLADDGPTGIGMADAGAIHRTYLAAPALLLVCTPPRAFQSQVGLYPRLLCDASAFGYALWLCAMAQGLEGCAFGRTQSELNHLLVTASTPLRQLFTLALGFPAAEAEV